jgi:hypothetical protein
MAADDIKPGSEERQPGCFYFEEDHERAAAHVREKAPEVFEWIKAHPDGLPDDLPMFQTLWRTAMEIMPKASLIDHGNVALLLRLQARPLTDEEKWMLENVVHRSTETDWRNKH